MYPKRLYMMLTESGLETHLSNIFDLNKQQKQQTDKNRS